MKSYQILLAELNSHVSSSVNIEGLIQTIRSALVPHSQKLELIKALIFLNTCPKTNLESNSFRSILHFAFREQNTDELKEILLYQQLVTDFNRKDFNRNTVLYYAIINESKSNNQMKYLKFLLENDADLYETIGKLETDMLLNEINHNANFTVVKKLVGYHHHYVRTMAQKISFFCLAAKKDPQSIPYNLPEDLTTKIIERIGFY